MSWIWPILAIGVVVLWTLSLIDIVRRRHTMSAVRIALWVVLIFVFPVLGAIVYFLVHSVGGGQSAAPRDDAL